ncbi:hypothetical protein MCEKE4_01927 [Acidimicrobiia bacterium]
MLPSLYWDFNIWVTRTIPCDAGCSVSLFAETRFTTYFCKPVDLRVWNYAHVPRGRGVSGTWRETRRNGPQVTGGRLVRGFEAGRKFN